MFFSSTTRLYHHIYGIWGGALFYFGDCILPNVWWYLGLASSDGDWKEVCTEIEPHSNLFIPVLGKFVVATTVLIFQVFLLLSDLST